MLHLSIVPIDGAHVTDICCNNKRATLQMINTNYDAKHSSKKLTKCYKILQINSRADVIRVTRSYDGKLEKSLILRNTWWSHRLTLRKIRFLSSVIGSHCSMGLSPLYKGIRDICSYASKFQLYQSCPSVFRPKVPHFGQIIDKSIFP